MLERDLASANSPDRLLLRQTAEKCHKQVLYANVAAQYLCPKQLPGGNPRPFLGQSPILNWPYMQDNGLLNVA